MTREKEGGKERERQMSLARESLYPPVADGDANRATDGFSAQWGRGWEGEGRGDEKKAVVVLPSLPFRVFTGLEWYGSRVQAA